MRRRLLRLAVPIICQNLLTYSVTLADNLMVGRLGEAAINGLFMAVIVQFVLQMILFGIESSMTVLTAQYWGRRDTERIKDIVAMGLRAAVVFAAAAAVATAVFPESFMRLLTSSAEARAEGARYLRVVAWSYPLFAASLLFVGTMRSVEVVRIGLVNSIVAVCVNVTLNWILIFGRLGAPALGVEGAAWATVVSRAVELGVALFFVLRLDVNLRLRPRDLLRRNAELARDLVRYGTPLMLGQIVWSVNKFVMRVLVGHFEPASSAAVSISETLDGLMWVGTVGLSAAVGVITGSMVGGGASSAEIKAWARRVQLVFAAIGVVSFTIVFFCGGLFVSLYKLEPATIEAAKTFMLVLAFSVCGRSYQAPCLMGLVKAGGDTSFVFRNDTFWVFCWVLPSALLARYVFHAPDWAVYAFLLSDQVTKCFVAFVKINRFHWAKNLTRAG